MKENIKCKVKSIEIKCSLMFILCSFIFSFSACEKGTSVTVLQDTEVVESTVQVEDVSPLKDGEYVVTNDQTDNTETTTIADTEPPSIKIIMVGDMLMHTKVVEKGLQQDGSYYFDFLFENVSNKIEDADIALVNQETILGGKELGLSGYPRFNSPYEVGDALVKAGFDVILHATNHALDAGKEGLLNCINFWEEKYPEVSYLGIYADQEAREDNIYLYKQNDITIAILNYTYSTNGIPTPADMPYAVNYLEEDQVIEDIQKASQMAEFVIVCPHWGTEYKLDISKSQEKWTEIFLKNGVDLVLGTHPHVIEPVEWVIDEEGNKMLVYYSLGNFVNGTSGTGSGVANRMVGGMADVVLTKNEEGDVVIQSYDAIPLVCHWSQEKITTYFLSDYTDEMAEQNDILHQDPEFSLQGCKELVMEVWGKDWKGMENEN